MKKIIAKIQGKVQGVGFRHHTYQLAQNLNLTGYVCNTADGGVEVVACGAEENLKQFVDWLKHGPPSAQVEKIDIDWQEAENEFDNFEIRN